MALSRKDQQIKDHLAAASTRLRDIGEPDLAGAVSFVLSPDGLPWLRRVRADDGPTERTHLIPTMPSAERDHLHAAAKEAGDDLSRLATQGLREFVSGAFRPAPLPTSPWGSASNATSVNLNLSVDADAKAAAAEYAQQEGVAERLGWKPPRRLRPANVARAYLLHTFPMFEGWPLAEMAEHYRTTESAAAVASRFGYPEDLVLLALEREGLRVYELEVTEGGRGLSEEERAEIVRRAAAGESVRALAADYGVAIMAVHRVVADAKPKPRRKTLSAQQRAEIAARYAAGASADSLAERFGVHVNTIYRYAKSTP
ncbi:helix-turn-helix domain-containing protein [Streptomyces sp. NPDC017529]|uniref:helix-turn-helix domain-containing protein n=1 Tax=Streptomyces sp. NPDC017529 TaxID=3365000 RepID=UPI00379466D3